MSHLTQLKTKIKDFEVLKKTLDDLNILYKEIEKVNLKENCSKTRKVLVIKQDNNSEIIFRWTGSSYEMLADLMFWQHSLTIESFMDKLNKTYSHKLITERLQAKNFQLVKQDLDNTTEVLKLTFERYTK